MPLRRTRRSREARRAGPGSRFRLQELQRLHVEQARRIADDVGVAQRLQELLGPVEVPHPDAHRPEALGYVCVGARAGGDPVLGGEAQGLLVELGDRDARVEDLDRVDLVEHGEQVLVVGHRVHAVERVRHVDEPALAPDLGDRLLQRHPARDLLLDEQADHLALLGGLHLLADDHLDAVRLRPRLVGAGDLVVVGDRDRTEPAAARLRQQHLDRRRAVVGVVGVHVQIDVDQRSRRQRPAQHRRAAAVVPARDQPAVDALEILAGPREAERLAQLGGVPAQAFTQPVVADDAREVRRKRLGVAGAELEPSPAFRQHLLVGRDRARDRDDAARERAHEDPGRRAGALGGEHEHVAAAQRLRGGQLAGIDEAHALTQRAAERGRCRQRPRGPDRRAPVVSGGSRRSARRKVRSAARSSSAIITSSTPSAPAVRRERVRAGRDHLVVTGEEARHQLARRAVAHRARIEP